MMIKDYIQMLGADATDKVTGFVGTISSISFDLYGCVMAIITPPIDEKGEPKEGRWFDCKRLNLTGTRKMDAPVFERVAGTENGASFKTLPPAGPGA